MHCVKIVMMGLEKADPAGIQSFKDVLREMLK